MHNALAITVNAATTVSAIAEVPPGAKLCLVFAHGAGAGMDHPFMASVASGLADLRVATLRYQFPYMERRSRRPDSAKLCQQTVQAAVAAAHRFFPTLPLFAGGKSFGGRMTSQAQAAMAMPHVNGLCLVGFPLHPPKHPAIARAQHLSLINIPMLFLQGSRDPLADVNLMQSVVYGLRSSATLKLLEHADHSFHVPVRSGGSDQEVMQEMLQTFAAWSARVLAAKAAR